MFHSIIVRTMQKEIDQGLPVRHKGLRYCDCGGHSAHDSKKNKKHNGYKMRNIYRLLRKNKNKYKLNN